MMLLSKFKKFDAHIKTVDGVNQQTFLGAVLTIISAIVIVILFISELKMFLNTEIVSRMAADQTGAIEGVRLVHNMTFHKTSCDKIQFFQEVTRGTIHLHEEVSLNKLPLIDAYQTNPFSTYGCQVSGEIITDKVGGNFRFSLPIDENNYNLTHTIHDVAFYSSTGRILDKEIPGISKNLHEESKFLLETNPIFQYSIQVIPTQYKTLQGEVYFLNQYSVVERQLELDQLRRTETLSGLSIKEFKGLIFTYDFHPVILIMEERREHIVDFISNLFGILGGTITVLSLFEGFLHVSSKVLIGKND